MASSGGPVGSIRGILKLLGIALAVTCAVILVILLPEVPAALPIQFRLAFYHPLFWIVLAMLPLCLGAERLARMTPMRWAIRAAERVRASLESSPVATAVGSWAGRLAALDRRTDPVASWFLGRPLTMALGSVCAVFLLTWAPHYLTWPFWADTEQFAISAQSWAAGIRPYRDLADFDFPGPIYLLYVLGKAFGWGRMMPFYAADLALLLMLGGALVAWSRRLFGTWTPGLIGFLSWLGYYLGRDYTQVAQRDWHSSALVVLGLLALESLPGRLGRPLSALGLAAALAYRPQPVLFGPAFLSAIEESAHRPGEPAIHLIRAVAWWSAALLLAVAIIFSPLIAAGVLDDFIGALSITHYGGEYNPTNWYIFLVRSKELIWIEYPALSWSAALAVLAAGGLPGLRQTARTWMLALIGAFCYQPMSPVPHEYLLQPLRLVQSVALAPLAGWLLTVPRLTPSVRLAGLVVLIAIALPGWPRYCTARGSLEALGPLARGEIPEKVPPGCRNYYPRVGEHDSWDDYRRVLLYLRHDVDRRRPVACLLRALPLPAVNGPTGHLSPFPAAGGFMHLLLVDPGLEDRFVEALERTPGTLVVWKPSNPAMINALKFPRIEAVVHRLYRPSERFGEIQVWARSDETGALPSDPRGGMSRSDH
jgi:hypothetical protein